MSNTKVKHTPVPYKNNEFMLLLNSGEDDEQILTFGQYIWSNDEADDEDLKAWSGIIAVLAMGESVQVGADNVKRIN